MLKWVLKIIFLSWLLSAKAAWCVELRELSINYQDFADSSREPYLYDSRPKEGINLEMDMDLGRGFFWDNKILSMTDPSQYRSIAWNFKVGVKILPSLDLQYEHLSRHLLDGEYPYMKFEVLNSLGLTWRIYENPKPRASTF